MRRSGANNLLQKVNKQLKGERQGLFTSTPNTSYARDKFGTTLDSDDDEIRAYLNKVGKKVGKSKSSATFDNISDISISSDDNKVTDVAPASSKFLKKKPSISSQNETTPTPTIQKRTKEKQVPFASSNRKGSVLDRAANLSGKYSKSGKTEKATVQLSDSDLELTLSMDEDDIAGVNKSKIRKQQQTSRRNSSMFLKEILTSDDDERDGDSRQTGKHFLKKSSSSGNFNTGGLLAQKKIMKSFDSLNKIDTLVNLHEIDDNSIAKGGHLSDQEIVDSLSHISDRAVSVTDEVNRFTHKKQYTQVSDNDDHTVSGSASEDLDKYMKNLSLSNSIRNDSGDNFMVGNVHLASDIESVKSEYEGRTLPTDQNHESLSEAYSADNGPTVNLMNLDELQPISTKEEEAKPKPKPSTKEVQFKKSTSRHSSIIEDSIKSYDSEIRTEQTGSPYVDPRGRISRQSARSTDHYTDDFSDEDKSDECASDKVTDSDIHSDTEKLKSSGRTTAISDKYSNDFTKTSEHYSRTTDDYSDSTQSRSGRSSRSSASRPKRKHRKKSVKQNSVAVQTQDVNSAINYQWLPSGGVASVGQSLGLGYVDPTPVATHAINPDALEALTSYSPSILALNDMMRQQIHLTHQFLQSQNLMYQSVIGSMEPASYKYTTYEDTKWHIKKQRRARPKLTFDEALKQVKQEMADGYRYST